MGLQPHRPRGARLARRLAALTEAARRAVSYRETLRENVAASASIRAALATAGLDPAGVSCLGHVADAEPLLLALGDTPALREADAAFAATHRRQRSEGLAASAARDAPRFAGRKPPERGASLLDWYAWSLSPAASQQPLSRTAGEGGRGRQRATG